MKHDSTHLSDTEYRSLSHFFLDQIQNRENLVDIFTYAREIWLQEVWEHADSTMAVARQVPRERYAETENEAKHRTGGHTDARPRAP